MWLLLYLKGTCLIGYSSFLILFFVNEIAEIEVKAAAGLLQAEIVVHPGIRDVLGFQGDIVTPILQGIDHIDVVADLLRDIEFVAATAGPIEVEGMHIKQVVANVQ